MIRSAVCGSAVKKGIAVRSPGKDDTQINRSRELDGKDELMRSRRPFGPHQGSDIAVQNTMIGSRAVSWMILFRLEP